MKTIYATATGQTKTCAQSFLSDEEGSATVWNMIWMIAFGVMAGLSIDSANAWRNKTMMVATVDSAAIGGAWDLPEHFLGLTYANADLETVKTQAHKYAVANMDPSIHGAVVLKDAVPGTPENGDIYIGHWDLDQRKFINGPDIVDAEANPLNAIHVRAYKKPGRSNSVPMSLLQWASLFEPTDPYGTQVEGNGQFMWDVEAAATAIYAKRECAVGASLISRGDLEIMSNATIHGADCLHGQMQVKLQNNITWKQGQVLATTGITRPEIPGGEYMGDWAVQPGQYNDAGEQIDSSDAEWRHLDQYPVNVDFVPSIGKAILTGQLGYRHFSYPPMPIGLDETYQPPVVVLPDSLDEINGTVADVTETNFGTPGNLALPATIVGRTEEFTDFDVIQENGKQAWTDDDTDLMQLVTDMKAANTWNEDTTMAVADGTSSAALQHNKIYFRGGCKKNEQLTLYGAIQDITLITDCKVVIDQNASLENAVLLTSSEGSQAMQLNGTRFGAKTTCENWGGVRLYSDGDIRTSADPEFYNVSMIARDEISFAAKTDAFHGVSMQAGRKIHLAAQAVIGGLDASVNPANPAGGCPDVGVAPVVDATAYTVALVE